MPQPMPPKDVRDSGRRADSFERRCTRAVHVRLPLSCFAWHESQKWVVPQQKKSPESSKLALPDQVLGPLLCAHVAHRCAPLAQPPRCCAAVAAGCCATAEDQRALSTRRTTTSPSRSRRRPSWAARLDFAALRRVGNSQPPLRRLLHAVAELEAVSERRAELGWSRSGAREQHSAAVPDRGRAGTAKRRARFPGQDTWPPAPPGARAVGGRSAARGSARCAAHQAMGAGEVRLGLWSGRGAQSGHRAARLQAADAVRLVGDAGAPMAARELFYAAVRRVSRHAGSTHTARSF